MLPSVTGFALAWAGCSAARCWSRQIYDYPGMGRLHGRGDRQPGLPADADAPAVQTSAVLIANLAADLLYGVLDPARGRRPEG